MLVNNESSDTICPVYSELVNRPSGRLYPSRLHAQIDT